MPSTRALPRIVVTGAGGQLGSDLLRVLEDDPRPFAVAGLTRAECDVSDLHRVRAVVADQARAAGPAGLTIINAAAWTDVDGAESAGPAAHAVNAAGPAHLAMSCAEVGARLVHVSTDYVFGGDRSGGDGSAEDARPYEVDDATVPRTAYGRTKLDGEHAVRLLLPQHGHVVRSGWLYGETGANFVRTMLRLAATRDTVRVVDDQHGAPTWTRDLATALVALSTAEVPAGTYHCAAAGATTWFGFAQRIFAATGLDPERVQPSTTAELARPAPRPAWSVLSTRSWIDARLPPIGDWAERFDAALAAVGPQFGLPVRSVGARPPATG